MRGLITVFGFCRCIRGLTLLDTRLDYVLEADSDRLLLPGVDREARIR